jgi:ATP-dependent exoDNAse (exonuclease V) beta subunit
LAAFENFLAQGAAANHPQRHQAETEVRACLDLPIFQPPRAVVRELWRERSFEIVLDGEWITGTCDRVVILADHAEIVDFKTDTILDETSLRARTEGYRPQVELYRKVVARLLGWPPERVAARLLFTQARRTIDFMGPPTGRRPASS